MCIILLIERPLFSLCPPSFLALTFVPPSLPLSSLSPEGRDVVETSRVGLNISRSLILSIIVWLGLSVWILICSRRKLLRCWLSKAELYKHSQIQLRVILLLLIFRPVVFGFALSPWTIYAQVLDYLSCVGMGLISWRGTEVKLISQALCYHYTNISCR